MCAAASQDQVESPSAEMLLSHLGSMSQIPTVTWNFLHYIILVVVSHSQEHPTIFIFIILLPG